MVQLYRYAHLLHLDMHAKEKAEQGRRRRSRRRKFKTFNDEKIKP